MLGLIKKKNRKIIYLPAGDTQEINQLAIEDLVPLNLMLQTNPKNRNGLSQIIEFISEKSQCRTKTRDSIWTSTNMPKRNLKRKTQDCNLDEKTNDIKK